MCLAAAESPILGCRLRMYPRANFKQKAVEATKAKYDPIFNMMHLETELLHRKISFNFIISGFTPIATFSDIQKVKTSDILTDLTFTTDAHEFSGLVHSIKKADKKPLKMWQSSNTWGRQ
jgi:hypothetical protein